MKAQMILRMRDALVQKKGPFLGESDRPGLWKKADTSIAILGCSLHKQRHASKQGAFFEIIETTSIAEAVCDLHKEWGVPRDHPNNKHQKQRRQLEESQGCLMETSQWWAWHSRSTATLTWNKYDFWFMWLCKLRYCTPDNSDVITSAQMLHFSPSRSDDINSDVALFTFQMWSYRLRCCTLFHSDVTMSTQT